MSRGVGSVWSEPRSTQQNQARAPTQIRVAAMLIAKRVRRIPATTLGQRGETTIRGPSHGLLTNSASAPSVFSGGLYSWATAPAPQAAETRALRMLVYVATAPFRI